MIQIDRRCRPFRLCTPLLPGSSRPRRAAAAVLGGLLLVAAALAQPEPAGVEAPDAEAAATEAEITVFGDRLEETLSEQVSEYGSRLETVTQEQVEQGNFVDTSRILSLVPGLYVSEQNGPFDYVNVSLQGSNRKEVLWLVDGVRVSNRLYDTTPPLDTLPASVVDHLEVLKGGQGLFYGTQAVGGVINIVTKGASQTTGGQVSGGFDSDDGTHLNGSFRGGNESHRFTLFASEDDADGFQPFRDRDYQPSSTDRDRSYDVATVGGRYRTTVGSSVLVSAHYQHTDAELDFASAEDRAASFNERDEEIFWAKVDWTPSQRFDLYVKAYWHDWDSNFSRLDNDLANPGQLVTISDRAIWRFEDSGINVLGRYAVSDAVGLLFGFDNQSYEGRDDEFLIGQQSETVNALFSQVRFDLDVLEGASVAVGARHNAPSDGQDKTVWDVSGELAIDRHLYARARVGTAFRLPSAYELYVIDPCCEQGNPNLVGEESFNLELAAGGRQRRFFWEAILFSRDVEDLIAIDFDLPAFPDGLIVNSNEEVEVEGFELLAGVDLTDALSATFDYTHSDSTEKGSSEQLDDIPVDMVKLILDWRPDSLPVGGAVTLSHVGEVYDSVASGIGRVEHGNYTVVDLAASYALGAQRHHRIGARVVNLFDEEYDTRVMRVRRDGDGTPYAAGALGQPRALYGSYTFEF